MTSFLRAEGFLISVCGEHLKSFQGWPGQITLTAGL